MHIGIDFDNTLVSYDVLFHAVACEWGLVAAELPVSKLAVRDAIRAAGHDDRWTEMQGHVYGARMDEAAAYTGAIEFIEGMVVAGHRVTIVSHKTRYPFLGPRHDLHAAAQGWLDHHLAPRLAAIGLSIDVYFELTKEEKLARIGLCQCDAFIDDLPEILLADAFPANAERLLFDPDGQHFGLAAGKPELRRVDSWASIAAHFGTP